MYIYCLFFLFCNNTDLVSKHLKKIVFLGPKKAVLRCTTQLNKNFVVDIQANFESFPLYPDAKWEHFNTFVTQPLFFTKQGHFNYNNGETFFVVEISMLRPLKHNFFSHLILDLDKKVVVVLPQVCSRTSFVHSMA